MSSQKKSSRLEGKDLITIGIYTVIYVVIVMLSRPGCSVVKWTGGFVGRSRTRMSGGRGE